MRKDDIKLQEEKYKLLHDHYADTLTKGANFIKYDVNGYSEVRLLLDENLKILTMMEFSTRDIHKVSIKDIAMRTKPDATIFEIHKKKLMGDTFSCYTLVLSGTSYIFRSLEHGQAKWIEGLSLAKFLENFDKDLEVIHDDIKDLSSKLDSLIRYQMNYSVSKVYEEEESPLKLLSESEYNEEDDITSEDELAFKPITDHTPPNALKISQLSKTAPNENHLLVNFRGNRNYGSLSSSATGKHLPLSRGSSTFLVNTLVKVGTALHGM